MTQYFDHLFQSRQADLIREAESHRLISATRRGRTFRPFSLRRIRGW